MTLLDADFRTAMLDYTALSDLIGERFYSQKPPQNPTYPLVTYGLVIGVPEQSINDTVAATNQHYWMDVWDTDEEAMKAAAVQVVNAFVQITGSAFTLGSRRVLAVRDLYDPDTFLFHRRIDATVNTW